MVLFEYKEVEKIHALVSAFGAARKIVFSNYYGVAEGYEYDVFTSENVLLIRKKEYHFYRLFFLCSDEIELQRVLSSLVCEEYVINIPTRLPIDDKIDFLNKCGFEMIAEYNRYYNKSIQSAYEKLCKMSDSLSINKDYELVCPAKVDEISQIWGLLNRNFSLYTDHIPNENELVDMVALQHVFVNKTHDGEIFGVHIFTTTKQLCYGNAWLDTKGYGILLSKNMIKYALEHNIKTINYWVRKGNKQVVRYHKMLGAVADGMSDYSFLKKNIS